VSAELTPRRFDPRRFAALRQERGLVWGDPLTYCNETGSTNEDALAAARAGAVSGSLFVAEQQSRGRGRSGKSWQAASGESLLFSLLLRPEPSAGHPSSLTLAVGLGVRAALGPYSSAALSVKWPNDVLAGQRKLAGILCEAELSSGRIDALVIGVGINISQEQFPPELAKSAVSLGALRSGPAALGGREELLVAVLVAIEARVTACLASGFAQLAGEFAAHDALRNAHVSVTGPTPLEGIARGVDSEGRLLLETDGVLIPVGSGTVRVVA
jgi:BirA family biotin operon repressor/biotin-[acetyl-CoA-carboxylase] ligase